MCSANGHRSQGFCGNIIKVLINSPILYSDEDIKNGKLIVLGELCEVSQQGQVVSSIFEKEGINSHTFEKFSDWYSSNFCLFPGMIQRVRGAQVSGTVPKPFAYTAEFHPSSWPYAWKGSRHKAPKHAFVVYVLGRKGNTPIVPPVQMAGARTADGVHRLQIEPSNPLVQYEMLVKLRSRIFEVNCCRRAGGPMMLTKWADAVRAKQVVPVAATKNLAKNELLGSKGTPKKGTKKLLKSRAAQRRKEKRGLSEESRKQAAIEAAVATDVLTSLSFSNTKNESVGDSSLSPASFMEVTDSPESVLRHSPLRSGTRAHSFRSSLASGRPVGTPTNLEDLSTVEKEATAALSFLSPSITRDSLVKKEHAIEGYISTGSTVGPIHNFTNSYHSNSHSGGAGDGDSSLVNSISNSSRADDARLLFDMSTNSVNKASSSTRGMALGNNRAISSPDKAVNLRTVLEQELDDTGAASKRPRLD